MTHDNNPEPRATALRLARTHLILDLPDGREVSVPLTHYPTLHKATPAQRRNWKKVGEGFHWPTLDLDLSIRGLLSGLPEIIPAPPKIADPHS